MSSRRDARERVLQALYAYEQGSDSREHVIGMLLKPPLQEDDNTLQFATRLFHRTIDTAEETSKIISKHAENWDLNRIALIDRLVLRMAFCELLAFKDIPPKVSVNEAIEVAKEYSTERSPAFINGVLDAGLLDLQREGRLHKSGRGLVGMESIRERLAD